MRHIWIGLIYINYIIAEFKNFIFQLLLGGGQKFERLAEIDVEAAEADITIKVIFYVQYN